MQILLRWAITAAALYLTVWLLSALGLAEIGKGPWYGWFLAVVVMALVNALIRPILRLLTAPLNCLTFGIVGVLINALMFWLVPVIMAQLAMPVFDTGFLGALLGAIVVGLLGGLLNKLIIRDNEEED
ncbi:MAG: phage holin family protein [Armatimonadota bacterium]